MGKRNFIRPLQGPPVVLKCPVSVSISFTKLQILLSYEKVGMRCKFVNMEENEQEKDWNGKMDPRMQDLYLFINFKLRGRVRVIYSPTAVSNGLRDANYENIVGKGTWWESRRRIESKRIMSSLSQDLWFLLFSQRIYLKSTGVLSSNLVRSQ